MSCCDGIKRFFYKFKLNDGCLHEQYLFWFCLAFPIVIGLLIAIPVWFQYKIAFNADAYRFFLNISALPMTIMALSPIMTAFVINAHRTIQTDKQIKLSQKKNTQDEYYAHHKYITELLTKQSMKIGIVHDDQFFSVSVYRPGATNAPNNAVTFEFKCVNAQLLYSLVFKESSLINGAKLERDCGIIDFFKSELIKLAQVVLFNGATVPNGITIQQYNENIKDFIRENKTGEFTNEQYSQLRMSITTLMIKYFLASDDAFGMNLQFLIQGMDNRSIAQFSREVFILIFNILNCIYDENALDDEFILYAEMGINISYCYHKPYIQG